MFSRTFPVLLLIVLTALTTRAAEQPLNVLIIQTDEHNFRTLGCYRKLMSEEQAYIWGPGVEVKTPNIDWLADNGAICTSYYATSPVCTPSRAALVSGRYPHHTGSPQNNSPLLGVEIDATAEGSDASAIFKKEAASDPEAITCVRIASAQKPWLGAFTSRYKLVASTTDPLAFFDLKKAPNELVNALADPAHRDEIRGFARGLRQYGEKFADPISVTATIRSDLGWAISDSDTYTPSPRSAGKKAEKK